MIPKRLAAAVTSKSVRNIIISPSRACFNVVLFSPTPPSPRQYVIVISLMLRIIIILSLRLLYSNSTDKLS